MSTIKKNSQNDKLNNDNAITDVSATEADAIAGGSMQPGIVPDLPQTGSKPLSTSTEVMSDPMGSR